MQLLCEQPSLSIARPLSSCLYYPTLFCFSSFTSVYEVTPIRASLPHQLHWGLLGADPHGMNFAPPCFLAKLLAVVAPFSMGAGRGSRSALLFASPGAAQAGGCPRELCVPHCKSEPRAKEMAVQPTRFSSWEGQGEAVGITPPGRVPSSHILPVQPPWHLGCSEGRERSGTQQSCLRFNLVQLQRDP